MDEFAFNHGLGEIVTAAAGAGFVLQRLEEHPGVSSQALPFMIRDEEGYWRIPGDPLPLSFSLVATLRPQDPG